VPKKSDSLAQANLDAYFRATRPPGPLEVSVGLKVGYTRYFCRQIGLSPTDPTWSRRGVVTRLHERPDLAYVLWADEAEDTPVSTHVLAIPGPNLRWAE
jgi:hypothetical protein